MKTLVVAGGDLNGLQRQDLPSFDKVIAADSGLDHAYELGLEVHRVVGDLDSVSEAGLAKAEKSGAMIDRYPAEKDATDLELAMDAAFLDGVNEVTVIAIGGGRLDHAFGNMLLLANKRYRAARINFFDGQARGYVVRGSRTVAGDSGSTISLFPIGGDARGVSTKGLLYPLTNETLRANTGRGLSNEMLDTEALISVETGVLIAIQP